MCVCVYGIIVFVTILLKSLAAGRCVFGGRWRTSTTAYDIFLRHVFVQKRETTPGKKKKNRLLPARSQSAAAGRWYNNNMIIPPSSPSPPFVFRIVFFFFFFFFFPLVSLCATLITFRSRAHTRVF